MSSDATKKILVEAGKIIAQVIVTVLTGKNCGGKGDKKLYR